MVNVEPPCAKLPVRKFEKALEIKRGRSKPLCVKKRESSIAKNASMVT